MSTLSLNQQKLITQLQQNICSKTQLRNIIEDYFRYYTTQGIKNELWMLTVAILSSDQAPETVTGNLRNSRLHFYEQSMLFIDAVSQLQQQKKKRKRNAKP